jgi:hypothetical protein
MWIKRSTSMHLDYVLLLSFPIRRTSVKRMALAIILFISIQLAAQTSPASASNPKVRAITGFVRLDRDAYRKQIADALIVSPPGQQKTDQ